MIPTIRDHSEYTSAFFHKKKKILLEVKLQGCPNYIHDLVHGILNIRRKTLTFSLSIRFSIVLTQKSVSFTWIRHLLRGTLLFMGYARSVLRADSFRRLDSAISFPVSGLSAGIIFRSTKLWTLPIFNFKGGIFHPPSIFKGACFTQI